MELIFFSKYIILELYFCLFLLSSGQDVRKRVEYNKDFNTTNTGKMFKIDIPRISIFEKRRLEKTCSIFMSYK
uniref:Uncharacterized protein n=1 Tax=Lepeophtheirus salmonis TaxID=72036 RepID=A0A0K2TGE0_LEPSM